MSETPASSAEIGAVNLGGRYGVAKVMRILLFWALGVVPSAVAIRAKSIVPRGVEKSRQIGYVDRQQGG